MRENCKRSLPWFIGRNPHKQKLMISAGGPSLKNSLDAIARRQSDQFDLLACNASGRFLKQNGITPDLHMALDPNEVVAGFFDDEPDKSIYLISSGCHPSVFEKLSNRMVMVCHFDNGDPEQKEILALYDDRPIILMGGGSTVALRAMNAAYILGYRNIHMYGVDSSWAEDGSDHAYVKHDGPEPICETVIRDGGGRYRCSPWMIKQAEDFKEWYPKLRALGCRVYVHGTGLIPDLAKRMNQIVREAA